uniref:Rab-GAP TBC domain-containing protein n=1 Tax=Panagrellus redivivus TaxID=6233 RepID=A0A7E4VIK1_PANRE
MMDSNAMQSIEGLTQLLRTWNFYYFRNVHASITKKSITLRLLRCPALRPWFFECIANHVAQFMPAYYVVRMGELLSIKRRH